MTQSKMIFIGQRELYNVFSNYSPDLLDFQKFYENIKQVDDDIDNEQFNENTCCLIVSSLLFHDNEDDFIDFVARISDAAVMNVLLIGNDMMDELEKSLRDFIGSDIIDSEVKKNVYNAIDNFITINSDEDEDYEEDINTNEEMENSNEAISRGSAKIITITSSKGGVGKSTNTLLIASGIKRFYPNKSVCIVDLDITGGQQYFLNSAPRDAKTVLNILEEDTVTEDVVINTMWHSPTGIDFLFAPKSAKNIEYLTPQLYEDILNVLSNLYNIVLIDTNAGNVSDITEQVTYKMADTFVVVTEPTTTSLAICATLINQELSKYNGKSYVIVNRVYNISDKSAMLIEKAYNEDDIAGIIPLRSDVILTAYEDGKLNDVLDNPEFADSYKSIINKILGEDNG